MWKILFLVYLHVEGLSAKGKVREIHIPKIAQKWHFPAQEQIEIC